MILWAAKGPPGNRRRFQPRHFAMLADRLAPGRVRWARRLADLPQGGWGLVIHASGSYSLGRALADRHAGGLFVLDRIRPEERRALEARDGVLIIDLDWDPLIPVEEVVEALIGALEAFNLPPSRVRLVHANQAARAPFEALWRRLSASEPCRTLEVPTSFALGVVWQHLHGDRRKAEARLEQARAAALAGGKARAFNSFNGGIRAHRLHVLACLHAAGLMDRGFVSMLAYDKNPWGTRRHKKHSSDLPPEGVARSLAKMPHAEEVAASVEALWRQLPLTLDLRHDFRLLGYERMVWSSQDPRYYDDSWFSAVMESHSNRPDVTHITEKAMKPMLNAHPFLYLGGHGGLARLRSYGFETFAPGFDESYDDQPWPKERMRRFIAELMRLSALPEAELAEIGRALWPRSEHNHRHFWGGAIEALGRAFQAEVLDQLL